MGVQHLSPWKPGQSGNPLGRPPKPGVDVVTLARTLTVEAINTLAAIMKNPDEPASSRVSAASIILDRLVSQQDRATDMVSPTIAHEPEPNARAFDLNAPPPNE